MKKFLWLFFLSPFLSHAQYDFEEYKIKNDSVLEYVYKNKSELIYNDRSCITDVKTREGECSDQFGKYSITKEGENYIEVYKNGTVRREVSYKNKVRSGKTTIYHPTLGYKFAELYYDGGKLWNAKYYDEKGVEIDNGGFIDGTGNLKCYRFTGSVMKVVEFKDGQANGACSYYYSDGKILATGNYAFDRPDGYWREFDREGKEVQLTKMTMGIVVKTDKK